VLLVAFAGLAIGRTLRSGEIDWWEVVSADFVPVLRADDKLKAASSKFLPAIGLMRFNQSYPPFDNVAVRRAMLSVIDQSAVMQAVAGTDPEDWTDHIGLFGPAMPLANDASSNGTPLRPADLADKAKSFTALLKCLR
jgi:peptide/nickel transport system substrate-binding protein